MNMNLFEWIRDAVRRSVLLGFSDAVEQIGLPATDEEELSPQMVALLQGDAPTKSTKKKSRSTRKRLGKSLKDMNPSG